MTPYMLKHKNPKDKTFILVFLMLIFSQNWETFLTCIAANPVLSFIATIF